MTVLRGGIMVGVVIKEEGKERPDLERRRETDGGRPRAGASEQYLGGQCGN